MPELSNTGKWIDTETGQVVDSQPAEGRLLVAPGGVVTPDVQRSIDLANEAAGPVKADTVETASEPEKVETATIESKTASKTTK